ncbi:MAG: class I SAM-dependent methyltransferase [Dehalococcoidia bacterium]
MNFETHLCRIAYENRTDKCPQIRHSYTPLYYRLLQPRRQEIKKVLELGIGTPERIVGTPGYQVGASLRMWRQFFPNAMIYGVDIDPAAMFSDTRIETILCDATDREQIKNLIEHIGADIDMVVDDASHVRRAQIISCCEIMELVNPGVFYFIEDIRHPRKVMELLSKRYDCLLFDGVARIRADKMILVRHK